eukprot:scaffold78463_cov28-Tisochrysis_lutea.AAC.5
MPLTRIVPRPLSKDHRAPPVRFPARVAIAVANRPAGWREYGVGTASGPSRDRLRPSRCSASSTGELIQ